MTATATAHVIALDRGYVCSQCHGFVRPDARVCKHCHVPLAGLEHAEGPSQPVAQLPIARSVRLKWGLLAALIAGSIAGLRAGLVVLGFSRIIPVVPGDWGTVGVAALSAFAVVTIGTAILCQFPTTVHVWAVLIVGALLAVLPHPLFWYLYGLAYGGYRLFPSEEVSTGAIDILFLSIVSLVLVGGLTIPLSIFATIQVWIRYTRQIGAVALK